MGDFDDDDLFRDFDPAADPAPEPEVSIRRATIRDGTVTLSQWNPWLADSGPLSQLLRQREKVRVAIADLRLETDSAGKRELIVEFMAAGSAREEAEQILVHWAANVGYERIWLPGGPVDLDPADRGFATASVTCPTCGAEWIDAQPSFWEGVRQSGYFPGICNVCGNGLPQWTVTEGDATRCRGDNDLPLDVEEPLPAARKRSAA